MTSFDIRAQNEKKGAFIDGARLIQYLDDNVALQEIKAGNLDTYYFRVPVQRLFPTLKIIQTSKNMTETQEPSVSC